MAFYKPIIRQCILAIVTTFFILAISGLFDLGFGFLGAGSVRAQTPSGVHLPERPAAQRKLCTFTDIRR